VVNIDQKNRGLPHNKIVFWLESSYGCTSPILGKIGGASRIVRIMQYARYRIYCNIPIPKQTTVSFKAINIDYSLYISQYRVDLT